jgi:4-diphosphocytidyl-2-C-methyl-D-erythritol kinase
MKLRSPAKINLFLQIQGQRPDGYHDLVTLMCPISLCDTLHLSFGGPVTTVRCSDAAVPEDESNLALQAANRFAGTLLRKRGRVAEPVRIDIDKRIPVGAGLGGGSSNAATVLLGLNRHYDRPFSPRELAALGRGIGADVPFFLLETAAVGKGIGDRLEPYPDLAALPVVLVYPGFPVSTETVYKNLNLRLTKCKKRHKNFAFRGRSFDVARHLCNDLEAVSVSRYPEIQAVKDALTTYGAVGTLMTGSGSAVFGLFDDETGARQAYHSILQSSTWQIFIVEMIP